MCDEGVFKVVFDIILGEPDEFADIFPVLGGVHTHKVLLRCCGTYISGCGMKDALIETDIYGKKRFFKPSLVSIMSDPCMLCCLSKRR